MIKQFIIKVRKIYFDSIIYFTDCNQQKPKHEVIWLFLNHY